MTHDDDERKGHEDGDVNRRITERLAEIEATGGFAARLLADGHAVVLRGDDGSLVVEHPDGRREVLDPGQ